MKNKLIILSVFTLLAVFSAHPKGSPPPKKPSPVSTVGVPGSHAHFEPVRKYTADETVALIMAEKLLNQTFQSKCFEDFMLKRKLIDTNNLTVQKILYKLKTADLTIPVEMYYSDNNIVGYRQPPHPDIYTNRKFHAGSTACARASNLGHEWSHTLGFTHSYNATKSRPYSIPYSINAAIRECCSCNKNSILDCYVK